MSTLITGEPILEGAEEWPDSFEKSLGSFAQCFTIWFPGSTLPYRHVKLKHMSVLSNVQITLLEKTKTKNPRKNNNKQQQKTAPVTFPSTLRKTILNHFRDISSQGIKKEEKTQQFENEERHFLTLS